ncbi:MAG: flagellar assembly protein T N-terminal domain-containing protein [Vibrionaceae bacterium]
MTFKISRQLFAVFILLFSKFSHAAWFEVSASSDFVESASNAKQHAIEDAVYQALKFAGADLASLTTIKPFLKENKNEYFFSGGEIRQLLITNVRKKKKTVKVTIRADIYPAKQSCQRQLYRKGVLLSNFGIVDPQHASLGSIFRFGDDFTNVLKKQFDRDSQSFIVQEITPYMIAPQDPYTSRLLAKDHGAQLLVIGELTDLSATIDPEKSKQVNRQLAVSISAIDGRTGSVVYQKSYRDIAIWAFDKFSTVDTQTARFWTSPFGTMARRVSRNILLDLETQFACHAAMPSIIKIDGAKGQIDAGRIHHVRQGDQLVLWHDSSFIDPHGVGRSQLKKSEIVLTVTRVYEKTAEVSLTPAELAGSVQIGDLVTKQI